MSKFRLAKVRISESLLKVRMFLIIAHGIVYYWTSSELYMAEVHVNFCMNAKVYISILFTAKVHILQLFHCVCLFLNS